MDSQELNEAQAGQLLKAFTLARKHFPRVSPTEILDGLELCRVNGGLYVTQTVVWACFRYHPAAMVEDRRMLDVVADWSLETLKRLDLRDGPVVHVMFYSAENGGFEIFRRILDALNPEGASAHRFKRGGVRLFSLRQNVRFRP